MSGTCGVECGGRDEESGGEAVQFMLLFIKKLDRNGAVKERGIISEPVQGMQVAVEIEREGSKRARWRSISGPASLLPISSLHSFSPACEETSRLCSASLHADHTSSSLLHPPNKNSASAAYYSGPL